MNNYYRDNGLLPSEQPFNPLTPYYGNSSPEWLYTGTEVAPYISYFTTDWILVELRDGLTGTGNQIASFVEVDGQVCSYNGSARLSIKDEFLNGMHIVIYHRNHLSIISPSGIYPVEGTVVSYDFTTDASQVLNGDAAYKEIDTGLWGMMSGDINGDQDINDLDNDAGWSTEAGAEAAYQGTNLFLDNQIDNKDKNDYWVPNFGKSSQVPN